MSTDSKFVPDPSWPSILELAIEVWGPVTDWSHDKNEARFGAKQSKSVLLREMVWQDHEPPGAGGGYVGLWKLARRGAPLPPRETTSPKPKPRKDPGGNVPPWENIGVVYHYPDAAGELILDVVRTRTGQPRFLQRAPDGYRANGEPKWKWSVKHIPNHDRLLYRLPGLRASGDTTVWIVEGEKDADNLHDLGLIATCNIGGAGKWRAEYAEAFRGKPVVILPDNDPQSVDRNKQPLWHPDGRPVRVGQDHADDVARSLIGIAKSVKVLLLPGLPEKGDVSNWLDAGGTVEELERLAREAPEFKLSDQTVLPNLDSWPEPVDILADSDTGAPILTAEHVPPALWLFIKDASERMGVATSSVAISALVSCSSAISEDWHIQPKAHDPTWTEQSRLWGAIVGIASILKSPVIKAATAPIVELNMAAHEAWASAMTKYRADWKAWKAIKKNPDPAPEPPRKARHLVESVTIEALQEVLRDDVEGKLYAPLGKVLARHDELSEFVANLDKYSSGGGGDRGAWLRTYDGGPYVVDRIGRGSFVTKSWSCCLIGGIQPEVIQRIAQKTEDDGLLQRFMFDVPAQQEKGEDRSPDYATLHAYRDLFPALVALRPARTGDAHDRHVVVVLHRDAHAAREDINVLARVMSVMPDASPRFQSALGKWPGLFARLCLTFHLIEIAAARVRGDIGPHPGVISADTAVRVQNYMRGVLAPSLLRADALMFSTRMTTHAAWVAGYILAHKLSRITAREIAKDYGALRAPEQRRTLDETMESLARIGWVEPVPPSNPAKPPTTWEVNPRVHVSYARRAEAERRRRDAVKAEIAVHVASLRNAANADCLEWPGA